MKSIFRDNRPFLVPYLLFLLAGGALIMLSEKGKLHLFFNQYHHPFTDKLFILATELGNGITALIVTFLLLFVRYRYAIIVGAANIISGLIAQLLKQMMFSDAPRPSKFFEGVKELYLVPGIDMHSYYSFPSGHTTTAFTLYLCLALIVRNNWIKALLFVLSLSVAFSRVYLSQHFFNDIYAGSLIGVIVSLLVYYLVENSRRLKGQKWLDSALIKRGR
jgi:membrane-associated phospholipid phosphatase